ncbi:hypothetical protein DTW90_01645 [Neorhizobium sp. P12A]|nr:hypothetical protein DTW90_01645 [Neorhizobium sp. P12A]
MVKTVATTHAKPTVAAPIRAVLSMMLRDFGLRSVNPPNGFTSLNDSVANAIIHVFQTDYAGRGLLPTHCSRTGIAAMSVFEMLIVTCQFLNNGELW